MAERLDAMHGIKNPRSGKTYWNKVGIAMPNKAGGYTLYLDYMPLTRSEDGKLSISLFPPRDRKEDDKPIRHDPPSGLDDDVPF